MVVVGLYIQRTYKAGQTIAIHKTYSRRQGAGIRRERGKGYTPDSMAKHNRKMAEREVAWVMHQNFRSGKDIHLNFTYPKANRPPPDIAKKDFARALDCMRKGMNKQDDPLKYISALGVGEKGGIHMHIVTNCTDVALLRKAWPHGGVHIEPLYANGDFSGLAKYFVNQEKEDGRGGIQIVGRWSCSRNLVRRPPKEKEIGAFNWREPPAPRKGYIIDVDSIEAGENPVTGIPYLFYRMVKIPPRVRPDEQEELRKSNRKAVRDAWTKNYDGCAVQNPAREKRAKKTSKPVPGREEPRRRCQL